METGYNLVMQRNRLSHGRQWFGLSENSLGEDNAKRTSLKRGSHQLSIPRTALVRSSSSGKELDSPTMARQLSGRSGRVETDLAARTTLRSANPLYNGDGIIHQKEEDGPPGTRNTNQARGRKIVDSFRSVIRSGRFTGGETHSSKGSSMSLSHQGSSRRTLTDKLKRTANPIAFPLVLRKLGLDTDENLVYMVKGTTQLNNLKTAATSVMGIPVTRLFFQNGKEMFTIEELEECEPHTVLFVSDGEDFYNVGNNTVKEVLERVNMVEPEYHFKVAVLGASEVGKTSLVVQYVSHKFLETYTHTIEDTYEKDVSVNGRSYKLTIVDTAGQDEFADMRPEWMTKADGYLFVYSMTSEESMEKLDQFYAIHKQLLADDPSRANVPFLLVANNKDRVDGDPSTLEVSREKSRRIAKEMGVKLVEVSALSGENVSYVFEELVRSVYNVKSQNGTLVRLPTNTSMMSSVAVAPITADKGCSCTVM